MFDLQYRATLGQVTRAVTSENAATGQ